MGHFNLAATGRKRRIAACRQGLQSTRGCLSNVSTDVGAAQFAEVNRLSFYSGIGHLTEIDYISSISQKGKFMTCLICGEPAQEVDPGGDYEERACPTCGHYRISGTALVLMHAHGWHFDAELTRKWLAQQQGSGVIPTIDSNLVARLIEV